MTVYVLFINLNIFIDPVYYCDRPQSVAAISRAPPTTEQLNQMTSFNGSPWNGWMALVGCCAANVDNKQTTMYMQFLQ